MLNVIDRIVVESPGKIEVGHFRFQGGINLQLKDILGPEDFICIAKSQAGLISNVASHLEDIQAEGIKICGASKNNYNTTYKRHPFKEYHFFHGYPSLNVFVN